MYQDCSVWWPSEVYSILPMVSNEVGVLTFQFTFRMVNGYSQVTVTVTAEFPLHCADEASVQSLGSPVLLGPLDHVAQKFTPITVVFVYRQAEPGIQELIPIDRLRRAQSRLLDYYPHLTGRIVINSKDKTPQIEQLGTGDKLLSAK